MKDKKKSKLVIIMCSILFVVVVGLPLYITYNSDYDPEKHVCTKMCESEEILPATVWIHCTSGETFYRKGQCMEWRNKNKCEIDPNEEGCVCDERRHIYDFCDQMTVEYMKTSCIGLVSMDIAVWGNPCIKAHVPNECEKGNRKYIVECDECIKMTLRHIECSQIKRAIHLNWRHTTIREGSLVQDIGLGDGYNLDDLYDVYILRCEN